MGKMVPLGRLLDQYFYIVLIMLLRCFMILLKPYNTISSCIGENSF